MTSEEIRDYCEEALVITEQNGTQDGLAFLIGEKFSLIYYQLKTEHNKLKFLFPVNLPEKHDNHIPKENKNFQLSYTLTINENYRGVFEQVDHLEEVLDQFIDEIRESFPLEDIQNYLNSFPRLAFKDSLYPDEVGFPEKGSSMTAQDIFSEVEDILIVDEMHSLFTQSPNE